MKISIDEIRLIGLSLKHKTTNNNGQSKLDCAALWHQFNSAQLAATIPDKISGEILGVYYGYSGDETQSFRYFVGCKVQSYAANCLALQTLTIPAGDYQKIVASGKLPESVSNAWENIWQSDLQRSFQVDFEVYDERCKDGNNAEVDIYVSLT